MIKKTDRITRNTNLSIEKVNLIKLTFLFYPDQNFPFERGDRGPPFFYLAFKGDDQRGLIGDHSPGYGPSTSGLGE